MYVLNKSDWQPNYSGRRRTSCMVHAYVPTIYKASEPEQVATSDLESGLERSYVL